MRRDAQEMMYDCIDESDIDRFTWEVWNCIPEHSPVEQEIKEMSAKRAWLRTLDRTLKVAMANKRQALGK